jgi:hypothetical protein
MHRIVRLIALAAGLSLAGASVASAQSQPVFDMKGTWKGTADAVVDGTTPQHPPGAPSKPAGNYRLRTTAFTYQIDGQDGKRFWGTISSDLGPQRLIGSLSADGKWIYIAGRDGILDGQPLDANTIDMCYRQVSANSAVISCYEMKRQK